MKPVVTFFILRSHFRAVTRAMWTGQRGSSSSGLIHSVKNNLRGRSRLNSFCFSLRAAGNFYGTGVELQYVCHDNEMGDDRHTTWVGHRNPHCEWMMPYLPD